jgi:hypothetical protein
MRAASEDSVQVALVVARTVAGSPLLVLLGEPRPLALLLSLVMLLAILDEATLALARRPFAFALDSLLCWLFRWRFA